MNLKLTGKQKCALIIGNLPQNVAVEAIKSFNDEELFLLFQAKKEIEKVDIEKEVIEGIFEEYLENLKDLTVLNQSFTQLYSMVSEALGPIKAESLINQIQESSDQSFDSLSDIDSGTLGNILQVEHPQTVALVLAHMDREKAAEILSIFSLNERIDIIKRFLTLRESPSEVKREIAKRLWTTASTWSQGRSIIKRDNDEKAKDVAEILHNLGGSKEILDGLSQDSPEIVEKIQSYMLVFKDLIFVATRDIQKVMAKVESKTVAMALKGVEQALQEHILSAMSKRVQGIVLDEKEALGPLPADEVLQAQQLIMREVKTMEEEGVIRILKDGQEGMLE
ncbi:flagellar motor switch protein FliG [Candidatus Uabimicrobium amorphum]|uniref:Flagellar motor switch protein FliG n=2 Tax=Uabimicrobium amorphum TaxID=2596890 RepID=A0A5S9IN90_UABAM|nr:flagellar motor switch protein FliG [Candidatus Uabimicrobium amorphum]